MRWVEVDEEQVAALQKECDDIEQTIIDDQGPEAAEAGGWECIREHLRMTTDYPDEVRREVARRNGIDRDLIGLADPDDERHW